MTGQPSKLAAKKTAPHDHPHVAIVSLQPIERVSRLRRFTSALRDQGVPTWLFAGTQGSDGRVNPCAGLPPTPGGTLLHPIKITAAERYKYRTVRVLRGVAAWLPGPVWRLFAHSEFAGRAACENVVLGERQGDVLPDHFDIIICHAFSALPFGYWLKARYGGKLIYDVTEIFSEQYAYSRAWRLIERPFVLKLERFYAQQADYLISPCKGYLAYVRKLYTLPQPGQVIRNTMERIKLAPLADHPAEPSPFVGMYQGLALPNRGLETYIYSLGLWPKDSRLVLQLIGSEAYIESLKTLAIELGLDDRVRFISPAKATAKALIASLHEQNASVGLCCIDPSLVQLRLSEPNKLFTYLAAGVAVITIEGTATGDLSKASKAGLTIPRLDAQSLSDAVHTLVNTPAHLEEMQKNAQKAGKLWSWENEKDKLIEVLAQVHESFS